MTATDIGSFSDTMRLLKGAQKSAASGAPAYSVYVNRRAGRVLAAAAFRLGLTPNMVTAISAVFTFASILVIALVPTNVWVGIGVGLGLAIGYAFDSADGQVARLRGGGSMSGEWLDHVVDCIKIATLHLAVVIAWYRFEDVRGPTLLLPLAFSAVGSIAFFSMILNDQLKAVNAQRTGVVAPRRAGSTLRSLMLLPTDYGIVCLVFLFFGLWPLFPVLYAALLALQLIHLALTLSKWFRDMRALDRENQKARAR